MRVATLSDVCDVIMGQAPPGESYNDIEQGVPLLAGAGDFGATHPEPKRFTTDPGRLSDVGDILLCVRATIGGRNWSDRAYCLGRGAAALRVRPGALDSHYLWHWLPSAAPELARRARGSTFKQVTRDAVESLRIALPPLAEQRRIAAMLDKADGIRRKRRESLRLLDEFLHSAYAELVGQRDTNYPSWPQLRIADLADDRPDSMRTGPFGSALRHSEFVDKGVAVLGIDNAVQNRFAWRERRFITEEKYEKFRRYTVRPGDVIVTIMGTTGRSAVVPEDIPVAISTKHLAVITVDRSRVHPVFLSHALHSDPTVLAQISAANRGAIMAGLNLGIIKRLRLRVPPLPDQQQFADVVAQVSQTRDRLLLGSGETDRLFGSLAQRTFQGRGSA